MHYGQLFLEEADFYIFLLVEPFIFLVVCFPARTKLPED